MALEQELSKLDLNSSKYTYITVNNLMRFIEFVRKPFDAEIFNLDLTNINALSLSLCKSIDYDILEKFLSQNKQIIKLWIDDEKIDIPDIEKLILLMIKNTTILYFEIYGYNIKDCHIHNLLRFNNSIISFRTLAETTIKNTDKLYLCYDHNHKIINNFDRYIDNYKEYNYHEKSDKVIAENTNIKNIASDKIKYLHLINCSINGIAGFPNLKTLLFFGDFIQQ